MSFLGKDKRITDISRDDAKKFHKHLINMVYNEKVQNNTAYKHIVHLRNLIAEYIKENDLDIENVFTGLTVPKKVNKRPTISLEYIKGNWINNPILKNMNSELRYLLWALIDTGCGPKELCGLDPDKDIHLDKKIPHIIIRANKNHGIKNQYRDRIIPLIGLALEAFKQHPKGFTRYCNPSGSTNASAALNKFLKSNNLCETDSHTIYGLRHCFTDRLRSHSIPEEMRDRIMGHKTYGMRGYYGDGYTLEQTYDVMKKLEKDFE